MSNQVPRVLALHPGHCGFGFVVMEGPDRVIDWGIKAYSASGAANKIENLALQYRPALILLLRRTGKGRRSPATVNRNTEIRTVSRKLHLRTLGITRREIAVEFSRYGCTKLNLALAVVHRLPQLKRWYPRRRKVWGGEDHRMKLFEAALVALTFYAASSNRFSSSDSKQRSTNAANSVS